MRRKVCLLALLLAPPSFSLAQEVLDTYCDGDECPTKYTIEGFEVRVSTAVFDAVDFTNTKLGQALDVLQGRLLGFEQMARRKSSNRLQFTQSGVSKSATATGIYPHPINQLRTANVSFYIQSDVMVTDDYSDCTTPCYLTSPNRIVLPIGRLSNLAYTDALIVHELAHAYQDTVMEDGFENDCVTAAYQDAVTDGGLYASVNDDGHDREPGNTTVHGTTENYAATNALEYFAVGAEAYLAGRADDYPYDRADLLEYDVTGFSLQWGTWAANDPELALSSECGLLADLFGVSSTGPAVIQEPMR